MKHQPIRFEQQRVYPMSVAEAWRLLADTDHLNRSIGLPSVDFSAADESLLRQARTRAFLVVPVRWREFPFDWVRERRYTVRREFESGPVACVDGGIELQPAGDGVVVKAFADFTPANFTGRFAWRVGRTPVTGVLDFCDRYLQRRDAGKVDPVPVPKQGATVDRERLDRGLEQLRRSAVRSELLPPLRERVLEGSDDQLVRVRPFAVADAWGADRLDVLRLFLHAARVGLFELRWELMCPNCRIPKAEARGLAQLPELFHCETCGISYTVDFDHRVELRFSVHPDVRSAADEIYCIGSPLRMPHVVAQQYIRPHEDRRVDVELGDSLRLRTVGATTHLDIVPAPPNARVGDVKVTYAGGRWVAPHSLLHGETLAVPEGARLTLRNQTDGPVLAVLEDLEWTDQAATAAQVTTLQEFRDLFGSEVLAPGAEVAVGHVALLCGSFESSNAGTDATRETVARCNGAIVKTSGHATVSAFHRLEDAVTAAIALQRDGRTFKLGLHSGPVIATTDGDRLDYLGSTADIAASLRAESRDGDVVLLPETLARLAPRALDHVDVASFPARARGLEPGRELVRLSVRRGAHERVIASQGDKAQRAD